MQLLSRLIVIYAIGNKRESALIRPLSLCRAIDAILFRDASPYALARSFAYDSLATSTKKAYLASWTRFRSLCEDMGFHPLPISSRDFAAVISFYAAREGKLPSILTMTSAVGFAHTLNGFDSPSHDPAFSLVMWGIKRKTFKTADYSR